MRAGHVRATPGIATDTASAVVADSARGIAPIRPGCDVPALSPTSPRRQALPRRPRVATLIATFLDSPAPCDGCRLAARCGAVLLACDAFAVYVDDEPGEDWRSVPRSPTRDIYAQIFEVECTAEGEPLEVRGPTGRRRRIERKVCKACQVLTPKYLMSASPKFPDTCAACAKKHRAQRNGEKR